MAEGGKGQNIKRRRFLCTTAAAGSGLVLPRGASAKTAGDKSDVMHIALIGAGSQGRVLLKSCVNIPGVRVNAVCDVWSYSLNRASRILDRLQVTHRTYGDYRGHCLHSDAVQLCWEWSNGRLCDLPAAFGPDH